MLPWYNWVLAAVTKPVSGFGIHTALLVHSRRQAELRLCCSPTGMRDASPLTPCHSSRLCPALKVPMACTLMQQLALIHTCTPPCSSSWTASYGRQRRATAATVLSLATRCTAGPHRKRPDPHTLRPVDAHGVHLASGDGEQRQQQCLFLAMRCTAGSHRMLRPAGAHGPYPAGDDAG